MNGLSAASKVSLVSQFLSLMAVILSVYFFRHTNARSNVSRFWLVANYGERSLQAGPAWHKFMEVVANLLASIDSAPEAQVRKMRWPLPCSVRKTSLPPSLFLSFSLHFFYFWSAFVVFGRLPSCCDFITLELMFRDTNWRSGYFHSTFACFGLLVFY